MKPKVIVIGGPTASGKTGLSIALAKKINGQIISADSMQIYKEMNIGTAKVTEEEKEGIPHYLIDIVSPNERYSVAQFKQQAEKAIDEILKKGCVPIIVGGTGLYINSLIYNIQYEEVEIDQEYREKLEQRVKTEGLEKLYEEAHKIDSQAAEAIARTDRKRVLRILEIYHQTGKTKTQLELESRSQPPRYDYKVFAISRDREQLYERINQRVDIMLEQGLIQEVESILKKYYEFPTAMQGLGYKEVVKYLNGEYSYQEMVEKLKMESRRYAKRQITWFKAIEGIIWLDGNQQVQNNVNIILEEI